MILLPGVVSQRQDRRSELALSWDGREGSLRAITGQQGMLSQLALTATVGGPITPAYGAALVAGKAQPRFSRIGGVNVLRLAGNVAGQDQERLVFPYAGFVTDFTLLIRLTGAWALGASLALLAHIFALGASNAEGGRLYLIRGGAGGAGTTWQLSRGNPTTTSSQSLTETAAITWPVDVLVTFTRATEGYTLRLRGANGVVLGPASGTASGGPVSGRFSGEVLSFGSSVSTPTATMDLYRLKLALAVYTYAQMDQLP